MILHGLARSRDHAPNAVRVDAACAAAHGFQGLDQTFATYIAQNGWPNEPYPDREPVALLGIINALRGHGGFPLDHLLVRRIPQLPDGVRADLIQALRRYYLFCLDHPPAGIQRPANAAAGHTLL